jgi:hypothetical protein
VAAVLHGHDSWAQDRVLQFEALPPECIQAAVRRATAAGVTGRVAFVVSSREDHDVRESDHRLSGSERHGEDADQSERLLVGSVNAISHTHDADERFAVLGVFDVSPFGKHGFA